MPNLDAIYSKCMKEIVQASGGKISEAEATAVLKTVRQKADFDIQTKGLTSEEAINFLIGKLSKAEELNAASKKWEESLRIKAEQSIWKFIEKSDDKVTAYMAFLEGTNSVFGGARDSVDRRQSTIFQRSFGKMTAQLREKNLLTFFNSPEFSDDITRELWKLGRTADEIAAMDKARPASRPEIRQVAELIHGHQRELLLRARRAGAPIGEIEGYTWRQGHDMLRMRAAGFDAWKAKISDKLDWSKIQEQSSWTEAMKAFDPEDFLKSTYEALISGVHLQPDGSLAPSRPGRETAKVAAHRKIHFRDADAWLEYNKEFGTANFFEGITGGMRSLSKSVALMERFGPNAQAMHDKIVDGLKVSLRTDVKAIDRLKNIDQVFNHAVGKNLIPGNPRLAQISSLTRKVISMQSLGGAGVASIIGDPNVAAFDLAWQGHNPLSALSDMFIGQLKNFGASEQKQFAESLGIVLHADMAQTLSRFDLADSVSGVGGRTERAINWAYDKFFRLNLLSGSTEANKTTFSMLMGNRFAQLSDSTFDRLPAKTQRMLEVANIAPDEWDVLRTRTQKVGEGRYWTADSVDLADRGEIEALMAARGMKATDNNFTRYRDDLDTRISGMFYDRTSYALTESGSRERRLMALNHDLAAGTPGGEAWRFAMQFKGYPITYMMKTMGREMASNGGSMAKVQVLGLIAAQLTVAGYLTMAAQDAFSGKTPPDPRKLGTLYASAVKGGGFGVLTDYMFGEYVPGRSLADAALGPAYGKLNALNTIRGKALDGQDVTNDLVKFARTNIPGQNLIWIRGMMDYAINNNLNEILTPGYMDRIQTRMKDERGQKFFIRP